MRKVALLLTSCVVPKDTPSLKLFDPQERLDQYIKAVKYYLENTIYPIVVVDNSNYDISRFFVYEVIGGRLEVLKFDGNNYNKKLGKGYGESIILKYAFLNSNFLKSSTTIVKITGRIIIGNLNKLIDYYIYRTKKNPNAVYADLTFNMQYIGSVFFIAPKHFYLEFFLNKSENINEIEGTYFEHVLLCSIKDWLNVCSTKIIQVPVPIQYIGYSGTTGIAFKMQSNIWNTLKYSIKFFFVETTQLYLNR